jgi:aspartyl aminopeptidase
VVAVPTTEAERAAARRLIEYIDASPSPYHAVAGASARLTGAGFVPVDLADAFPTGSSGPGRHLVVAEGSLVAWSVPEGAAPHAPIRLVVAHTDSPNLRVKPHPDKGTAGWRQLGVEVYGAALLSTWLDRDLGLSGRVAVACDGRAEVRLVRVDRPLLRVPQLAIHLDRDVNERGLVLNRAQHLAPVWGVGLVEPEDFRRFLAGELELAPGAVRGWDVMAHDLAGGTLLGADESMVSSPRIDNLLSCHAAVDALVDAEPDGTVAAICLFDHEEVGSTSSTGALAALLPSVLERLVLARGGDREALHRALAGGVCVSADGAHATHPNYADRHDPEHQVAVNAGPVLKYNANQRYATHAPSAAVFEAACERVGVPLQRFVVRSDLPCGSTVGPLTAAGLGIATVDVGVAQLAMHSARELCGATDPGLLTRALRSFLTG